MTAHAERVGVLALLGLLMLVGWSAIALGLATDNGAQVSRTVGGVVSKRDGATTIVIGGPFASAAIVVPDTPDTPETLTGPVHAAPGAAPDALPTTELPAVFGSVALPDPAGLLDPPALFDPPALLDAPALDAAAMAGEPGFVGDPTGFDGASVVMEADRILADSAALEELWRLPALTAEQRQTAGKQV